MIKTTLFRKSKISYSISGNGPALVLVHGFPMDSRVWNDFIPYLEHDFTVLAIDLPGFGHSQMLDIQHDMHVMADAVKAVIDAENFQKIVLTGHSMGGYVGLAFAKSYPERLNGLVLFHSQAEADDVTAKENRNKAIETVKTNHSGFAFSFVDSLFDAEFELKFPEKVAHYSSISMDQTMEAIVSALAGLRDRESHINLLTEIEVPVLFILGKSDSRMPFTKIMAQAALPLHAEMLLLAGVGHMGFAEATEITCKAVRSFCERCN
ncbi:MAG: alpha/beta hydrolase [Bacteroidales bacterium]|nr:alpha/beta hydrolase [Bacteroidales bacterium]